MARSDIKLNKRIEIRLSDNMLLLLTEICGVLGVTTSYFIRQCIEEKGKELEVGIYEKQ